ncbi:TPA: hypothetical protein ACISZU_000132 [Salmonella enterica subsp. enterica serovar Potsdam]
MTTRQITVTRDWQQLTDGTKDEVIQFYGEIAVCNSPTKPAPDAPSLRFNNQTLTITRDDIAWVRTASFYDSIILVIW